MIIHDISIVTGFQNLLVAWGAHPVWSKDDTYMGFVIYFGWENMEIYELTIKIHPKSLYLAGPSPFLNFPILRTRQHIQPHVVFCRPVLISVAAGFKTFDVRK